jgi:hypothetical protein
MNSITIEELVKYVNAGVVKRDTPGLPTNLSDLDETTARIITNEGGTPRLAGDWLIIASMIVTICKIVVTLLPMLRSNRSEAEKQVRQELTKQTDDPKVGEDPRIKIIVELAVRGAVRDEA